MDSPQAAEKPVVYVLHGDDPLAIRRGVDALVHQMGGDPGLADMNTTHLDGRQSSEDEIRSSANSMPFMVERRLVILTTPFARATSDAGRKRFLALLDGLPPSTAMVLVVEDIIDRGDWKTLPLKKPNWVRKWLESAGHRALYKLCTLPSIGEMVEWTRKEARKQGGQFTPEAASALVAHIGNDTQQASLEINKLLTYVDLKRAVEIEDVEELTAQAGLANVFDMVDAVANGSARQALTLLHRLLETQDPPALFGMLTRQFRLLVQAREILDEGRGGQMAAEMHLPGFVADRLAKQARRFTMPQLVVIYHRLLLMDEGYKTGVMPLDLALDTFIVELAN